MGNVQKILDLANAEQGYQEKKTNSELDNKTANSGSNNFTKYARDLDAIGFFNGNKQGYAWCSVYVHWIFYKAFGKDKTLSMFHEPSKGNLGAGVDFLWKYFNAKSNTYSKPKVGDIVVFSNAKYTFAHVGIVTSIDSSYIYTSEGNTSVATGVVSSGGSVCSKKYPIGYKYIYGYCRPDWKIVGGYDYSTKQSTKKFTLTIPMLQNGSQGNQVKALQVMLVANGYSVGAYGCDGDFGDGTEKAVKEFQSKNKLTADGIAGSDTYTKLLGI